MKRLYVRIAERALGHELPPGALVHHVDEDRSHNFNANLCILQNRGEHSRLHKRLRVLRAGGDPWTQQICSTCRSVKDFAEFSMHNVERGERSRECRPCVAARAHRHWSRVMGRIDRYLTPYELSEMQRGKAVARWQKAG